MLRSGYYSWPVCLSHLALPNECQSLFSLHSLVYDPFQFCRRPRGWESAMHDLVFHTTVVFLDFSMSLEFLLPSIEIQANGLRMRVLLYRGFWKHRERNSVGRGRLPLTGWIGWLSRQHWSKCFLTKERQPRVRGRPPAVLDGEGWNMQYIEALWESSEKTQFCVFDRWHVDFLEGVFWNCVSSLSIVNNSTCLTTGTSESTQFQKTSFEHNSFSHGHDTVRKYLGDQNVVFVFSRLREKSIVFGY